MRWWSRDKKYQMPALHKKQEDTLQLAVAKAIKDGHADWKIVILCRDPKRRIPGHVTDIPMSEARDVVENLEEWLRGNFGSGEYIAKLMKPGGTEQALYSFAVWGGQAFKTAGVSAREKGDDDPTKMSAQQFQNALLMKLLDKNGDEEKTLNMVKAIVEITRPPVVEQADPFKDKLMGILVDNAFVEKQNVFENLRAAMMVFKEMQPPAPSDDSTMQMLSVLVPSIASVISSRTGQPVQQTVPNVMQQIAMIPDDQLLAIAQSGDTSLMRAKIAELVSGGTVASQDAAALPQPGERTQIQELPQETAPITTGPAAPDHHLDAVDTLTEHFRQDIRDKTDPGVLAATLIGIIEYNRALAIPHRLYSGLVNATVEDYERQFDRFCAAIPELSGPTNAPKAAALKMAMTMILVERHGASQDTEPVDVDLPLTDDDTGEDDGLQLDEPGSAGLRGHDGGGITDDGDRPEQPGADDGVEAGGEAIEATPKQESKVA